MKYWVEFKDYSSVQQNELYSVIKALQDFPQELNIVANSAYIEGVVQNICNAVLHYTKHSLLTLFKLLQTLIQNKNSRIFITHVRSHTNLPGYLTFGNAQVDKLVAFSSAQEEHKHLHTNANHLHVQYKIPFRQPKQIIFKLSNLSSITSYVLFLRGLILEDFNQMKFDKWILLIFQNLDVYLSSM